MQFITNKVDKKLIRSEPHTGEKLKLAQKLLEILDLIDGIYESNKEKSLFVPSKQLILTEQKLTESQQFKSLFISQTLPQVLNIPPHLTTGDLSVNEINKFGTLGLIKPNEVGIITSSIRNTLETLKNSTKIPKNLRSEINLIVKLVSHYCSGIKNNVLNDETRKYLIFWTSVSSKLEAISKQLPDFSIEDFFQEQFDGKVESFKLICNKIDKYTKLIDFENHLKNIQDNTLIKMGVDWELVRVLQDEQISLKDLDNFGSDLLELSTKKDDIEFIKVVLASIYSLLISYFNNEKNDVGAQLLLPKIKEKLFKILTKHSNNPDVLEPLHHSLNYIELAEKELLSVINTLNNKHIRDSKISVSLLGFYNKLKGLNPNHTFFREQNQISESILKMLEDLKEDPESYNQFVRALTKQISPTTLKKELNAKYIQISNLISRLVIDPQIFESSLRYNSSIGIEIEGAFQPGDIPNVKPPHEYTLGIDGGNRVQEIRTNYTIDNQAINATLDAYLNNLPDLIRFIQTNFNMGEKIKMSSLHIHFDSVIHKDIPKLWNGRTNSGYGIIGETWESREHGITAFSSPEYFAMFMYAITSLQNAPNTSQAVQIFKGNLAPYFFEHTPITSLLLQANQNVYNDPIYRYINTDNVIDSLSIQEQIELFTSEDLKELCVQDPEVFIDVLSSNKLDLHHTNYIIILPLLKMIDFEGIPKPKIKAVDLVLKTLAGSFKYYTNDQNPIPPIYDFVISLLKENLTFDQVSSFSITLEFLAINGYLEEVFKILDDVFYKNSSKLEAQELISKLESQNDKDLVRLIDKKLDDSESAPTIPKIATMLKNINEQADSQLILDFILNNLNSVKDWDNTTRFQRLDLLDVFIDNISKGRENEVYKVLEQLITTGNYNTFALIFEKFGKDYKKLLSSLLIKVLDLRSSSFEFHSDSIKFLILNSIPEELDIFIKQYCNSESFNKLRELLELLASLQKVDLVLDLIEKYGNKDNSRYFYSAMIQVLKFRFDDRVIEICKRFFSKNSAFYIDLIGIFMYNDKGEYLLKILNALLTPDLIVNCKDAILPFCWNLKNHDDLDNFTQLVQKNTTDENHIDLIEIYTKLAQYKKIDVSKSFINKYVSSGEIVKYGSLLHFLVLQNEFEFVKDMLDQYLPNGKNAFKLNNISETLAIIFENGNKKWVLDFLLSSEIGTRDVETRKLLNKALMEGFYDEVTEIIIKSLTPSNIHFVYNIIKQLDKPNFEKIFELVKTQSIDTGGDGNEGFILQLVIENSNDTELEQFIDQKITKQNFDYSKIEIITLAKNGKLEIVKKLIKKFGNIGNVDTFKNALAILLGSSKNGEVIDLVNTYINPNDDSFYSNLVNRYGETGKHKLLEQLVKSIFPKAQIEKNSERLGLFISNFGDR